MTAADFSSVIAVLQIYAVAEENDRPSEKPRRQIDETVCISSGQDDAE